MFSGPKAKSLTQISDPEKPITHMFNFAGENQVPSMQYNTFRDMSRRVLNV